MFIKEVKKSNTPKGKVFYQYQLSETFRVDGKVKHKIILYLGSDKLLNSKENRFIVAKLLENKIRNTQLISEELVQASPELTKLVDQLYSKYQLKQQKESQKTIDEESIDLPIDTTEYESVDLKTVNTTECREIGAEWMCCEMLDRLDLKSFLEHKGWSKNKVDNALISVISRAVASFSEHKTESWLNQNSALLELFDKPIGSVSRHHLYSSASDLYELKDELETYLYNKMTTLFDVDDTILIYDLTNTHFEGQKLNSKLSNFGRNKQKRSDCKQVVLGAVINKSGFLKHSNIYEGNMSDPQTLIDIIDNMGIPNAADGKQTIIVIDAGIATAGNLEAIRKRGYLYVAVSRSKPHLDEETDFTNAVIVKDKQDNEIKLKSIELKASKDSVIHVLSHRKALKENSMMNRAIENFELEMSSVVSGIEKKGGTKKIEKVWERIGRIKERNKTAHKYYDIKVEDKDGIATKIEFVKKDIKPTEPGNGEYFLRTNYTMANETEIWDIYNTIREVESTFRCLKSDLRLRPVYHKEDRHTNAHLYLGLLAYQIVSATRFMLKKSDLNYDWRNIVRIMNTQKAVTISITNKDKNEVIIRNCSRPIQEAMEIYKAVKISSMPFTTKKYVVTH